MTDALMDRIKAHRSAPDVYDPPTFEDMADRIEALEAKLAKAIEAISAAYSEGFLDRANDRWPNNPAIKRGWLKSYARASLKDLERTRVMSDYRIECASKEEWAERAMRAEAKLAKAVADLAKAVVFAEIVERTGHDELEFLAGDMLEALKGRGD